jgi:hypothetical protein
MRWRARARDAAGQALARLPGGRVVWRGSAALDQAEAAIRRADVCSFDVFDTALIRPLAAPDDAFWLLAPLVREHTGRELDFRRLRIAAEAEARAAARARDLDEVTLDEIYQRLRAALGVSDAVLAALAAAECELERELCTARPLARQLYELATRAGKRVVFVSDTYLPAAVVAEVLARGGYTGYERLLVSSEHRASKRRGSLFRVLVGAVGGPPGRIVHVGDAFRGDVWRPYRAGLAVVHLERCVDQLVARSPRTWRLPAADLGHSVVVGLLARRLAGPDDARALGYRVLGPAFAAFAAWLTRRVAALGLGPAPRFVGAARALAPGYERVAAVWPAPTGAGAAVVGLDPPALAREATAAEVWLALVGGPRDPAADLHVYAAGDARFAAAAGVISRLASDPDAVAGALAFVDDVVPFVRRDRGFSIAPAVALAPVLDLRSGP